MIGQKEERQMEAERKIEELQRLIDTLENIVFFGGAGVSTESGIPDFRSVDGLYHQKYDVPPETILSHSYFLRYPEKFYAFYRDKMLPVGAKPNAAHKKHAELEAEGKLKAIVTQNIDGLHQAAGSIVVYDLLGSIHRIFCMKCVAACDTELVRKSSGVPRCEKCGGMIKPDVVLYEESLNEKVLDGAIRSIAAADLLIVGGTSLAVYPAAGLLQYFQGDALVLINKGATPMDNIRRKKHGRTLRSRRYCKTEKAASVRQQRVGNPACRRRFPSQMHRLRPPDHGSTQAGREKHPRITKKRCVIS